MTAPEASGGAALPAPQGPVTVVVINYNGVAYLPECLEAIRSQGSLVGEILVVDDVSTDASLDWLREHAPDVRVIVQPTNAGPGAARNAGLREARCDWVLLVDNDAVLTEGLLVGLDRARRDHPGVCLFQPRSVFDDDPSVVHYDGGHVHYAGLVCLRNFYVPEAEAIGSGCEEVDVVISVVLFAHRQTLLDIDGFDPAYFILFEDLDLSVRLRLSGQHLMVCEHLLCRHKGGTAGISFRSGAYPSRRVFLHARNRRRFLWKTQGLRTLILCGPGHALYGTASFVFACKQGAPLAWLRGTWAFVRSLPELWSKRRVVQRSRQLTDRELLRGGPLTITPDARGAAGLRSALDGGLQLWWRLVRRLCS